MSKTCKTCAYSRASHCLAMKHKIESGCFAWANEKEAAKREKAIEDYATDSMTKGDFIHLQTRIKNTELRGYKQIRVLMEERLEELYNQNLYDKEIATELKVSITTVKYYREKFGLLKNPSKNRRVTCK